MNARPHWAEVVLIALAALAGAALVMCAPKGEGTGTPVADEVPVAVAPAAPSEAAADGAAVEVADGEAATAAVGRVVRVRGTARNAKLAAAVVGDGLVVYCLDRDSWSETLDGKAVVAEGTLEHTDEFAAKTGPDGAIGAGTGGPVYVIRACAVTPAG